MRGGALPPALLASALGFALAFAPRRAIPPAVVVFAATAVVAAQLKPDPHLADAIFYLCWGSVVVTALSLHLPGGVRLWLAQILAANAGAWAGLVIAVAGVPFDLAKALPWVLICLPAAWLISRRFQIAISLLAAALPATTPTPGYVGDHME